MASHVLAHYPLGARVVPAINAFVTLISSPSLRLAAASGDAVAGEVRSRWMISMRSQFDPKCSGTAYRVLDLACATRRRGTANFSADRGRDRLT